MTTPHAAWWSNDTIFTSEDEGSPRQIESFAHNLKDESRDIAREGD